MASIEWYAGEGFNINNLAGSGIGFYGANFGDSVDVGEYQDSCFITNGAGTSLGPQIDNIKWLNSGSGTVNGTTSGIPLTAIPNYLATLNIRFVHSVAVKTQNAKLYCYDRTSIANPASGVTFKAAELIHPDTVQNNNGSGDTVWLTLAGTGVYMDLVASPGMSGLRPNGAETSADRHDWYTAMSASPDSVGSKTQFGVYFSVEYL